jgi:hypothetical protein
MKSSDRKKLINEKALARLLKFSYSLMALTLVALLLWPARVNACACCSEPGVWYEKTDRLDSYESGEINRLRFDALASTYMTEAGEDGLDGISNPAEEYSLALTKRQGRWELKFRDKQGHTGTLTLTVPNTMTEFQADIHDGQESPGGGPLLYKEWRLTGTVIGTGVFGKGSTPQTKYRLVFQGRGNSCTSAEMFEHWTLQIFGPRASYSFYGKFKEPAPPKG